LDSNFEIALKEFIVHRDDLFPRSQFGKDVIFKLFKSRPDVISAVSKQVHLSKKLLDSANHFYEIRNKLIHERASVEPTDTDVVTYRIVIESILATLFHLRF
jgi:hypothetical protein